MVNMDSHAQNSISFITEYQQEFSSITAGSAGVVWRSQCNGCLKRERRELPVKTASDIQKDLAARKTHFHSHYIYNAF